MQISEKKELLAVARGERRAELVLKNANIVDVFTCSVFKADIAIYGGYIAGVGSYEGEREEELSGKYVTPGLIDAHVHMESSMVCPSLFGRALLPWGTTAIVADPHEIANVSGLAGMRYMLEDSSKSPVEVYFSMPSCVPLGPHDHNGAALTSGDLQALLCDKRAVGLGEVMDYLGAAGGDDTLLEKISLFEEKGKIIDGHSPGAEGRILQAYRSAGVQTDHECTTWEEALERLRAGFFVQIREGSAARNLSDILKGAVAAGVPLDRFLFCTDDQHLSDIARHGNVLNNVKQATALGVKPESAVRMATLNAAQAYGLRGRGAVAAGCVADLVVFSNLQDFHIETVYKNGVSAAELLKKGVIETPAGALLNTVNIPELAMDCFELRPRGAFPVIGVIPGQIVTIKEIKELPCDENGLFTPRDDLLKIAVVQRHDGSGRTGVGAVRGFGLRDGAVASTVAHDSHNLVLIGSNDADMLLAVRELRRVGGGYTAVRGGKVLCTLPLPVAGLFAQEDISQSLLNMKQVCKEMGVDERLDVFQNLSFMSLPVIPALRITDDGVFDVVENRFFNESQRK